MLFNSLCSGQKPIQCCSLYKLILPKLLRTSALPRVISKYFRRKWKKSALLKWIYVWENLLRNTCEDDVPLYDRPPLIYFKSVLTLAIIIIRAVVRRACMMDSTFTIGQSVSLAVKCPSEQKAPETGHAVHKPGDIVPAYMELYKHRSFDAVSLHGSIVGETRVWTNPADREDIYQTMIYLHLDQTNVISHALPLINTASGRDAVIVPITFVLPELVTRSKNTNGRMPPSCEAGRSYVDPWGRLYMQPLIEYFLQVTLRYRLLGETAIRTISAKRKIKITTSPHSEPPTYSQSLLEEKAVKASADVRKSWFAKPFARLNLAMAEPLPVVGHATNGSCGTVGVLRMDWTTSSEAYDDFELGKRPVRIEYYLRGRTRYGTRAIQEDETDGNSTGSNKTRPHTRTETKPLGVLEVRSSDRKDVRITASEAGQRSHSGTIPIPIQIEDDAIPTFSHLLASRDYAILVKVSIQGLQHAALSIEVPLQVCENHYAKNCDGTTVDSSVFREILTSEILPSYEDHKYSVIM